MAYEYPAMDQAAFNAAHDELDSERTVYPVKRGGEDAFVVLKRSVDEAMRLKRVEVRVLVPEKP